MENGTHIRIELGIDARKIMQHVLIDNELIEDQLKKGIELALEDISKKDNFVEAIRQSTKNELNILLNQTFLKWEVKNKISKIIEDRIGEKINDYAEKFVESITKNIK